MATCEPTIGDTVTLPGLALSSPGGCLVWFLFSTSLGWKAEKQQKCTTPVRDNNKLMFYAQSSSAVISGWYTFCHHAPVSERGWHVYRVHTEFSYFNIPKPTPVSSRDQRLVGNLNVAKPTPVSSRDQRLVGNFKVPKPTPVSSRDQRLVGNLNVAKPTPVSSRDQRLVGNFNVPKPTPVSYRD